MRIGVNCFMLRADIGGMKQYFVTLFDWLLANDTENEYVLFFFDHNVRELANLRSSRWRARAIRLDHQREVLNHLEDIDLYFCPFGPLYPKPMPLPTVITLPDIQQVFYPQFFTEEELLNRIEHYHGSARMADRVITLSEYSKATIARHYHVSRSRISVAYVPPDSRFSRAEEIAVPPDVACPDEFLFYPSNRWRHKNHDVVLRALRLLKQEGVELPFVVTGHDIATGYPLAEKVIEYGLGSQVFDAGYVSLPQLAFLYRQARLVVFPSLFEGFGIPVVEAMTVGTPVLASNVCSLPEVGHDAVQYFNPRSPEVTAATIHRYWFDDDARRELVERGRQRVTFFSLERMAKAHLVAFRGAHRGYSRLRYCWHKAVVARFHKAKLDWYTTHGLSASLVAHGPDDLVLRYRSGWHSPEIADGKPLRWSWGRGVLNIVSRTAVAAELSGAVYSLQRPNEVRFKLNGKTVHTLRLDGDGFGVHQIEGMRFDLRAGKNKLEIISRQPALRPEKETRLLAVAAVDFKFRAASDA